MEVYCDILTLAFEGEGRFVEDSIWIIVGRRMAP